MGKRQARRTPGAGGLFGRVALAVVLLPSCAGLQQAESDHATRPALELASGAEMQFLPHAFASNNLIGAPSTVATPLSWIARDLHEEASLQNLRAGRPLPGVGDSLRLDDRRGMLFESASLVGRTVDESFRYSRGSARPWSEWEHIRSETASIEQDGRLLHAVQMYRLGELVARDFIHLSADGAMTVSDERAGEPALEWPPRDVNSASGWRGAWTATRLGEPFSLRFDGVGGCIFSRPVYSRTWGRGLNRVELRPLADGSHIQVFCEGQPRVSADFAASGEVIGYCDSRPGDGFMETVWTRGKPGGDAIALRRTRAAGDLADRRSSLWIAGQLVSARAQTGDAAMDFELQLLASDGDGAGRLGDGLSFAKYRSCGGGECITLRCTVQGLGDGGELLTLSAVDDSGSVFWRGQLYRRVQDS